jgi:hypothetical protein
MDRQPTEQTAPADCASCTICQDTQDIIATETMAERIETAQAWRLCRGHKLTTSLAERLGIASTISQN